MVLADAATPPDGGRPPERRWWALTSEEVATAVADPGTVGLVPVGAIEQHGPHLPVGTDAIVATRLCERVSARSGALVLPVVAVGSSYGHGTTFPGTISLAPELLAASLRQYLEWAATSGLRRLLLINAHMANESALLTVTDHLRLFRPDLQVGIVHWWQADPSVATEVTEDAQDPHANRAETAIMLELAPELVRRDRLASADDPDRTAGLVFRYTASALSCNGVTGRPSEATSELGARLVELIVDAIAAQVERARVEEPPLGRQPAPPLSARPLAAHWPAAPAHQGKPS